MRPIKVRRLSEIIESDIQALLMEGKILPGERLPTEKELSKQFGVSIITMRQALRALIVLGFIEKRKGRNGGIFAAQIKSASVKIPLYYFLSSNKVSAEDLAELSIIIEPYSIGIAVGRITPTEIKRLKKMLLSVKKR